MVRNSGSVDVRAWVPGLVWGVLAYGVHKVGVINGYYLEYGWFQNLTHACSASALAALVAIVGLHLGYRGRRLVAFVVVGSALGAVGWEVIEYFGVLDPYGIYFIFHDFHDAAIDMVSNSVGVAATLLVLWYTTGLDPDGYSFSTTAD